jgi:hypothetical protein
VWATVVGAVLGRLVVASGPGFNRLLSGDLSSRYEGVEYLGLGERERVRFLTRSYLWGRG